MPTAESPLLRRLRGPLAQLLRQAACFPPREAPSRARDLVRFALARSAPLPLRLRLLEIMIWNGDVSSEGHHANGPASGGYVYLEHVLVALLEELPNADALAGLDHLLLLAPPLQHQLARNKECK